MQSPAFDHLLFRHKIFKTPSSQTSSVSQNKLAARGTDVFYAVGNTIRCSNLVDSLDYKVLNLPIVQFPIRSILLNSSETLLAVIGSQRVVVCDLPPNGFMNQNVNEIKVRCRDIGSYCFDGDARILKVLWNPIHRYDANLIILTSDNTVRSFDLLVNSNEPEQEIQLSLSSVNEGTLASHSLADEIDEFEAVSMTLGTASEPFGRVTLYVLSKEGDVYALSPFVPNTFVLTQTELETIFDSAVAAEHENRHSESSKTLIRRHYKRQLDWASNLWSQASISVVESRQNLQTGTFDEYYVLKKPEAFPSPQLQGPFKISPYPDEFYYKEAIDIGTIDNGACTVVCITYNDGSILLALQLYRIDLNWAVSEVSFDFSLDVVECISLSQQSDSTLSKSSCCSPTVFVPYNYDNYFYIINDIFVHRIDISPWSKFVIESIHNATDQNMEEVFDNRNASKIVSLVNQTLDNSKVCGIFDVRIEKTYTVTVTEDNVWIDSLSDSNPQQLQILAVQDTENIRLPTYLDEEFDIYSAFQKLSLNIPRPKNGLSLKDPIGFNFNTLKYSHELGVYFSEELSKLHQIGLTIHNRLIDQRCELHRQILSLKKAQEQNRKLIRQNPVKRVERLAQRQETLQNRTNALLRTLSSKSSASLPLSNQEKSWNAELERIKASLSGVRGLDTRVKTALLQADMLLNDKKLKKLESSRLKSKSSATNGTELIKPLDSNSKELKKQIFMETEIINNTKDLLEGILKDIKGNFKI